MNGQIQYGSARPLTSSATLLGTRAPRVADPSRFRAIPGTSRSVILLFGGSLVLGGFLAAVPREIPGVAIATVLGGAWLSLVLAMTLPTRSERAGAELSRRLAQFRHELNIIGDRPSREALEALVGRARELELRDEEIAEELAQIRASIAALDLAGRLARADLPVVDSGAPLAPGDVCHFNTPVRFGRRRSDQFGHLVLTDGWLKFRGALDVSVAWSEVADVQRAGRELIVSLHESKRVLRFSCQTVNEAAQAGVLAQYLAGAADPRAADASRGMFQAAV